MTGIRKAVILAAVFFCCNVAEGQEFMTNVYGRDYRSLNGKWSVLIDIQDVGKHMGFGRYRLPQKDTEVVEYAYDNALQLNVPGDWNSQLPEFRYYESTMFYGRHFDISPQPGKRLFLYFGAVNYRCKVYFEGKAIGTHEGGFTPFQLEITDKVTGPGRYFIALEVNNQRTADAIPAMTYDWWNYGGITRDVLLISTPETYIEDYFIRLNKYKPEQIDVEISLSDPKAGRPLQVEIPELGLKAQLTTDEQGYAKTTLTSKRIERWSPESPRLYKVIVSSGQERIEEEIGFRNLYVRGTGIYLNDRPIFLKGISFHEEIPQRKGRAYSEADAVMLLSEAKALGANAIRLAHYPQNEHTVRMAERMGFLLWEEIPVWQGIRFSSEETRDKATGMIREMVRRDRNRCAMALWSVANETRPSPERNAFLKHLIGAVRELDTTRLITAAFDGPQFNPSNNTFEMDDSFAGELDVVAVNKYIGWYLPWPADPATVRWNVAPDKPLLFSEFGGEALYGRSGEETVAHSWNEEYQAKLYRDNLTMFGNIPNLRGTYPWALFDFCSPYRHHPVNQSGFNRKGLVSDQGLRKKAWYVMRDYYRTK